MPILTTVAELEALYGLPGEASTVKVTDRIIPEYAAFIAREQRIWSDIVKRASIKPD